MDISIKESGLDESWWCNEVVLDKDSSNEWLSDLKRSVLSSPSSSLNSCSWRTFLQKKTKLGFSLRVSDADKNFDFLSLINLTIYLLMQYMFDWYIYVNSSAFRHQINNPQNKVDIHLVSWQLPHPNSLKWHKIQTKFSTADRQFTQFALKNLYPFYWAKFLKKSLEHIQTYKYTLFWGRKCPDCPKE